MQRTLFRLFSVAAFVALLTGCGASTASQPVVSTTQAPNATANSALTAPESGESDVASVEQAVNSADSTASDLESDAN